MRVEWLAEECLQGPIDRIEQPRRRRIRMAMPPALAIKHRQPGKYRAQAVTHVMRDMRQRPADRDDVAADPEVRQTIGGVERIAGGGHSHARSHLPEPVDRSGRPAVRAEGSANIGKQGKLTPVRAQDARAVHRTLADRNIRVTASVVTIPPSCASPVLMNSAKSAWNRARKPMATMKQENIGKACGERAGSAWI